MSLNTVFNNIRSREKPNDVFITPRELAKLHIARRLERLLLLPRGRT